MDLPVIAEEVASSTLSRESFWSRLCRRQTAASAAAIGSMNTWVSLLIKLGAVLTVLATLSGATMSAALLQRFGVNVLDYVSLSDLPTLGLRFVPECGLTVSLAVSLAFLTPVSAWMAAHSILDLREAVDRARSLNWWERSWVWIEAAWRANLGYALPGVLAASTVFVAVVSMIGTVVAFVVDGTTHVIPRDKVAGITVQPKS
jgi:hypothetical protein